MTLGETALKYAGYGWAVFPLHGITDTNRCTCGGSGCGSPGKHPRTVDGFKSATTDPAKITAWWADYPDSNIGVATGAVSGLVVVDADSETAADTWEQDNAPTLTARTGKGKHFYYQHPGHPVKNQTRFLPDLDVRGDGGYVVAAPSRHISGDDYEWTVRMAPAPYPFTPSEAASAPTLHVPRPALTTPLPEGGRNATLTRHVGGLFAKGHSAEEVQALALGLNQTICRPPLDDAEVTRIVRNIAAAEWSKRPDLGTVDPQALARQQSARARERMAVQYDSYPPWFSPALQRLVGPPLPGETTVIGARPGSGKTTMLVNQALHLADKGHRILYLGMEMPPEQLLQKIAAVALGYDEGKVLKNNWALLPKEAPEAVASWVDDFAERYGDQWLFCPEWQLGPRQLIEWMQWAAKHGFSNVILDHLHEMDWGDDETSGMAEGIKIVDQCVKREKLTLYAAAQLKRGMHDALEDYMVPPQSAIKQCGKIEEKAALILMLHRTLKPVAGTGDLEKVRRGQMKVSEIADHGTVSVHVAKDRHSGSRDEGLKLYLSKGKLYDRPEDANAHEWEDVV